MNADYWNSRYLKGETGWDMGMVSPPLKAYIDQLDNKALRILIPGGGNSYEAAYLWQQGFKDITVLDYATVVIDRLQHTMADTGIRLIAQDFFQHETKYDLILEQTFFCALDVSLRKQYVQHMYNLLEPKGHLAGVLFNREFAHSGPPFGGSREEYQELFGTLFHFHTFEPCYNSHPARQGSELFINFTKQNQHNHAQTF
jgi:SAM-dependent methyltransferase